MTFLRRYQILIFLLVSSIFLFGLLTYFLPFLNSASDNIRPTLSFVFLVSIFGFSLIVFFVAFRWAFRPFKQIAEEANQVVNPENSGKNRNESDFMLDTFQSVLNRLQQQQTELERLNKKVSQRAETAEKFSERVMASLPSGLIAFDEKGVAKTINGSAREIFSIENNIKRIHFRVLFEKAPTLAEMVENCLESKKTLQRQQIITKLINGRSKKLGATIAPIDSNEGGVLCLITDITEITQLREQIALKRNLESLGEMSAGIAHEFKNSLAALQSYAQLFQRLEIEERGKFAADELLKEVKNLSEMTTSFLDFARPKPLNLSDVSLETQIKECAEELAFYFVEKKVELKIIGKFATIQADERMLRQAFLNLLRNAVEAIPNDAKQKIVKIKGSINKDFCVIEIQDTGNGINETDLPHIFVPFFTTKEKGHGIGLALAHRVITHHNGDLTAENTENTGAIFSLKLPLFQHNLLNNNTSLNED